MILVIDNYDSFTYNLVQLLLATGFEVRVERNDHLPAERALALGARAIVLSPGPGRPEDAGICCELVDARPKVPILGVCLGHQVLGHVFGAEVGSARRLMHGKTSPVRHEGRGIFRGLPDPFSATRYHSLAVIGDELPEELEALAWSDDGELQGMRHRELPYWGVQFHPESILTPDGPQLVRNFLELAAVGDPKEAGNG